MGSKLQRIKILIALQKQRMHTENAGLAKASLIMAECLDGVEQILKEIE